jgi:hypothetical protein
MTATRPCTIAASTRGLKPLAITIQPGADEWRASAPIWKEYLQGQPELFLDAPPECGLTINAIERESERTPNTVYR